MSKIRLWLLVCLTAATPVLVAQNITGTISGVVEDPSGGRIDNAAITALNADTGISYRTSTSNGGLYVLPLLPVGRYRVAVETAGVKRFV